MHELGLVYHIVNRLEELVEQNSLTKIQSVTIELGEVSGVVPDFLIDGWNWTVKKHPVMDGAEMKIETLPALTVCNSCSRTYGTVEHGRICPYCGSEETELLKGREMSIKEIEAM